MNAKNATIYGPMAFGLVFLCVLISLVVAISAPAPKSAADQQQLLQIHEGVMYFFDAEKIVKPLAPDPSLTWSHQFMDSHTSCSLLGKEVWYASGSITGPTAFLIEPPTWEICFSPASEKTLYVRVGSNTSGDVKTALQAAGRTESQSSGASGEK